MYKKILGVAFILYTLFGFILLPLIIKSQIEDIAAQETNSKLYIDDVYFNPFNFKIQLSGIVLETLEKEQIASLDMLLIDLEPHSLFMAALHIKSVIFQRPQISISHYKNGLFNFSKIIKERADEPADEVNKEPLRLPRVIFDTLMVDNGSVSYEDFNPSSKFELTLTPISFKLTDIDTKDIASSDASLRFNTALSDGGEVAFRGDVLSLSPLKLEGNLKLDAVKLYTNWKYIQDKTGIEIADGAIYMSADYYLNLDDLNATKIDNANLRLANLRVKPQAKNEDILKLLALNVDGVIVKPMMQDVYVKSIELEQLSAEIKRDKEGKIDWIGYLQPQTPALEEKVSQKETNTAEKSAKWNTKIDDVSLKNIAVILHDKSIEPSVKITLDKIELYAKNISSKEGSRFTYDMALRVNGKGGIRSKGDIKHTPLEQKGSLELKKIALKDFTPYLQEAAYIKIDDGALNIVAKTAYKQKDAKDDIRVDGNLKIDDFLLNESRDGAKLASFKTADIKSFSFKSDPNSLQIDELLLDSLYVDAVINRDKSMNFSKLAKESQSKEAAKKEEQTQSKDGKDSFAFNLLKLRITNSSAHFADYSLPIDFKTFIHDLNGEIHAISNVKGEVSDIDIDGVVDEYGSTKLKGSLNSSDVKSYLDIDFNFKNLDLSSVSGYSAEFAGYKIDKGKLFLDLKYNIENSELKSKNSIIIRNIELGDTIEDENITKLPLGFAIALLEDKDGVIDIDLPIEGNIDKPDFKYGALIVKTLANLIVKAVASPFKFLGAMMGIDAEKLKTLEFEAGEAILLPPQREKLDNLADILVKKPKLSLALTSTFDKELDLRALKAKKLDQKVFEISKEEHPTTKVLQKIYAKAGGDVDGLKESIEKSAKEGMFDIEYKKALYERCVDIQNVDRSELEDLANTRADAVQTYLSATKGVDAKALHRKDIKEISGSKSDVISSELEIELK
ncbi:DUF748 domain-containing protein [Sulfurimonas crateris]|uniref:DUF748 domain-containing protein n=1 Tax=Sulfurimonas crateris TaxID=2574727 RepID=A0A4V5TN37_9BACT|nr:DUF748 domain-containing protein [Sulfurimonas crateris]TKI68583.1 DUF748 domain-containing protein [Sulfurimonas crateris]